MPSASAAECEPEPCLLLALVTREREFQKWHHMREEFLRRGVLEDVRAHRLVTPGEVAQLGYVKGVLHEPHIENEVCGGRQPVLVAEALDVHEHPALARSVALMQGVAEVLPRQT